jgi:hypothetical protein
MTLTNTMRGWAVAGLVVAALATISCSASTKSSVTSPTSVARFTAGESASGKSIDGTVSAVAGIYNRALGIQGAQSSFAGASELGSFTAYAVVPAACSGATVKYFNAQGQEQSAYNPTTTTRITGKGPCVTSQGVVTVDVVVDDMQQASSTMLINGTASAVYEGFPVTGTISGVRMSKQLCGAPSTGTIVALMDGITFTVRFDGTLNAAVTYMWGGATVSFIIPMKAC